LNILKERKRWVEEIRKVLEKGVARAEVRLARVEARVVREVARARVARVAARARVARVARVARAARARARVRVSKIVLLVLEMVYYFQKPLNH